MGKDRSSDASFAYIQSRLPPRWVLHSIQLTEDSQYSVLLYTRGPMPRELVGRIYGLGRTPRAALNDAADKLDAFLMGRPSGQTGSTDPEPRLRQAMVQAGSSRPPFADAPQRSARQAWRPDEVRTLSDLRARRMAPWAIAPLLGRSMGSVQAKARRVGLGGPAD